MFDLATSGYPQILPVKNWVSFVSSNNDVGSNFCDQQILSTNKKNRTIFYM